MESNDFTDKIDDFLDGKLSPEETSAFEQAIKTNKQLADSLQLEKQTREAIDLMAKEARMARMRTWYAEMEDNGLISPNVENPRSNSQIIKRILPYLIGVVLLGMLLYWWSRPIEQVGIFDLFKNVIPNPAVAYQGPAQSADRLDGKNGKPDGSKPEAGSIPAIPAPNPFADLLERERVNYEEPLINEYSKNAGSTDSIENGMNLVSTLLKQKDYTQAIRILKRLNFEHVRQNEVLELLSFAYQSNGQVEESVEAYLAFMKKRTAYLSGQEWRKLIILLQDPIKYKNEIKKQVGYLRNSDLDEDRTRVEEIRPLLEKGSFWTDN